MDRILKKQFNKIFFLITLCGIFLYFALIGGEKIWADEAYTFSLIKQDYRELIRIAALDVHPPLYYLLLKLCIQPLEYSLTAAKIVSIVPYVLILIGGYEIKRMLGEKTAILFMGLFLIFPFTLRFAVEARMYSLAAMFVFYCAVFAYRWYYGSGKFGWFLFILSGVGAAYTHYFALVSVGMIYLILGLFLFLNKKKELKFWMISVVSSIALYLPWLSFFIGQLIYKVENEYWIGSITIKTLFEYVKSIFGVDAVNLSALFIPITYLMAMICLFMSKNKKCIVTSLCMLAVPIGTIFLGVLVSFLVRPVFIIRYVVPAIPLVILFLSYVISEIKSEIVVTVILTANFMVGLGHYADFYKEEYHMPDNFLNSTFVEKYEDCDAFIVVTGSQGVTEHTAGVLSYYNGKKPIYVDGEITQYNPNKNQVLVEEFNPKQYRNVLLLVGTDLKEQIEKIDFYSEYYQAYHQGTVDENGHISEVYLLNKK